VRKRAAQGLAFLGVQLDSERNLSARPDIEISTDDAPVRALVITAREDLQIAREVRQALGA
jgi:acetate kinase